MRGLSSLAPTMKFCNYLGISHPCVNQLAKSSIEILHLNGTNQNHLKMESKMKANMEFEDMSSKLPLCSSQVPRMNVYEDLCLRFPSVAESIFKELDNKSLAKCRKAYQTWRTFMDDQKFSWIRKIRFCSLDSKEPMENILKQTKLDVVKE